MDTVRTHTSHTPQEPTLQVRTIVLGGASWGVLQPSLRNSLEILLARSCPTSPESGTPRASCATHPRVNCTQPRGSCPSHHSPAVSPVLWVFTVASLAGDSFGSVPTPVVEEICDCSVPYGSPQWVEDMDYDSKSGK